MITLFDWGPNQHPDAKGISVHVWKTRYALNYKGIPYTTVWVDFTLIEETAKQLGALPTAVRADGSPKYTVPIIKDSKTGAVVSDSLRIAEYLDETYPDTPPVVPKGSRALQAAFADTSILKFIPFVPLVRPHTQPYYSKPTQEAFDILFGGPVVELSEDEKTKLMVQGREGLAQVSAWLKKDGVFVMGDKPVFVDFSLAAWFFILRIAFGKDSREWKEIADWDDGRWSKLLEGVESYQVLEV
ncbi:hypothetical protein Moror_16840 [Moniliophthora roreri MCA 2997]|uniref:GST N-terminal domain-containing protein n=2 Tax=Moniliophthora roreri TaxID=221103 RepID=V2X7M9_MONRO|nr:hypothetical protein Moror_16840 [Moniliophthora roreri MCA 2997]KAI3613854.1 hypothetical protein WG66_006463 [Moniliophthora roreri]